MQAGFITGVSLRAGLSGSDKCPTGILAYNP
uniref:Uncharacterized protein n=1 Tax=Microviridae sp. ctuZ46 TaxID=2825010 RepID=A0A8S5UVX2_9VIRU|nr:MAG TPA: hypothetical protein [Microviridae sp. ctuZ46]